MGYHYLKKYSIAHILFYIDFAIVLLNIGGNLAWGIEQGYRDPDGYESVMKAPITCASST